MRLKIKWHSFDTDHPDFDKIIDDDTLHAFSVNHKIWKTRNSFSIFNWKKAVKLATNMSGFVDVKITFCGITLKYFNKIEKSSNFGLKAIDTLD